MTITNAKIYLLMHLSRGVGQSSPLKALGDLAPQLAGICDGLEEEGVLLHTLDAKGVVDASHTYKTCTLLVWWSCICRCYASRQHSQLTQSMQWLSRSAAGAEPLTVDCYDASL